MEKCLNTKIKQLATSTCALSERSVGGHIHERNHSHSSGTYLLAFWADCVQEDIVDEDMRVSLRWAARELNYPAERGDPHQESRHLFTAEWGCECTGFGRVLRHTDTDTEDGKVVGSHVQRIREGGFLLLF